MGFPPCLSWHQYLRNRPIDSSFDSLLDEWAHTKNTYLGAQCRCLATRSGPKKTIVAVGHSILVIIYHVLQNQTTYPELGGNYFNERKRQAIEKRLVRRLEQLGFEVSWNSASPVA